MILSDKDIAFINFAKDVMDKGRYADSMTITETYNRVFGDRPNFKPINNTNCGQCIRHRVGEMWGEMKKALAEVEQKED